MPGARQLDGAWRFFAGSRPLQAALLAVLLAGWVVRAVITYNSPQLGGLFRWIGVDFGFYLAQAGAFVDGHLSGIYSIEAVAPYREALASYSSLPGAPMPPGQVPYPPVFAWLLSPLARMSPPLAFAIWTVVSAAAALVLAWRVAGEFPPERRLLAAGLLLVSTPLAFTLWFGQVQIFLSVAFGEAFLALRRGRGFAAGLWLAVLILKPQYLLLIVPVLLWKRPWDALVGFAAGGLAILGASILAAGPASIGVYVAALVESATASGGTNLVAVAPDVMVNWRALVLAMPLAIPEAARLVITLVMSGLTIAAVVVAVRGPWHPSGSRFAGQMTLLGIGTLLAAYHSHIHGVAMIAVPLAAFIASGTARRGVDQAIAVAIRVTLAAGIVAPWLWFVVLDRSHTRANGMVALALVIGFALLFVYLRRSEADPSLSPARRLGR